MAKTITKRDLIKQGVYEEDIAQCDDCGDFFNIFYGCQTPECKDNGDFYLLNLEILDRGVFQSEFDYPAIRDLEKRDISKRKTSRVERWKAEFLGMLETSYIYGMGHYDESRPTAISGKAYNLTHKLINPDSGKTNYYASGVVLDIYFRRERDLSLAGVRNIIKDSLQVRKGRIEYNTIIKISLENKGVISATIVNLKITAGVGYDIYYHWLTDLENYLNLENERTTASLKGEKYEL